MNFKADNHTIKEELINLIERYQNAKNNEQLENSSEATIRAWIDELLNLFGWDVQNTHQVLTERSLGKTEQDKLHKIGSSNTRPDYTLVNGKVLLSFVDAKSLAINIENDQNAAFQIRSYGWSIGASFSVVTNFEQLAIYDCSIMPRITDRANYARKIFLTYNQYVENYDLLNSYLSRENIVAGNIKFIAQKGNTLDEQFSKMLGEVRKNIAKAILDKNNIDNTAVLSYYVQTIINRILFIRVCESRGLEEDGLLDTFSKTDFWGEFKKSSYVDFYNHYDGPLFKKIKSLQNVNIDNEILVDFIKELYYPSPYCFDVIPLKTLGDIYDLFLGYQLVVDGDKITDELKSEFKKSNGAITTPEAIVKQVICSTMPDTLMESMPLEQLLEIKIADIACGSGVFLVGAFDYLVDLIEKKITKGEPVDKSFYTNIDGRTTLTIKGRKAIINNCLYGVDINPEAVEVSKLSLSLKLIDKYYPKEFEAVGLLGSQILDGIGKNIKCGNSLVGDDIETVCPSISKNITELQNTNAFDWKSYFPEVFSKGGFDFIIGNPPYVEVKNYNTGLPNMAVYIKTVYKSSKNGKVDLAIPFIEQGINLLNSKGRLGYVIQKRFFKDQYGKGIRQLLTRKNKFLLNGVYDYEETDLFAGRTTYVAIIVCDRDYTNNSHIWYLKSNDGNSNLLLSSNSLSENPWNFENPKLNAIKSRLKETLGTLHDVCKIKVGIQVLWNDAFQIVADKVVDGIIYGHSSVDQNIAVELGACRPLICNEQFIPLTKRKYRTFALFPYSVSDDGVVKELSITEFTRKFPKAGAYLTKHKQLICANVETLPQKNTNYNQAEYWHLFTRANNHGAIYPKICVPMTAQYSQAAVILDKHVYCDNANMFFIEVNDTDEIYLYALSAIINSTIFNSLARTEANPQRGGYYKFNKQFLEPVPVPVQALMNKNKEIIKLATIAKKIETINEQIIHSEGLQISGLKISLASRWKQLDEICNKLYGIKKHEELAVLYSIRRNDRNPYEQKD